MTGSGSPSSVAGGGFERISWEQAVDEIAAKLKETGEKNGPRAAFPP
jgi:anaerobic selenocysteine-containing dehydrogenase